MTARRGLTSCGQSLCASGAKRCHTSLPEWWWWSAEVGWGAGQDPAVGGGDLEGGVGEEFGVPAEGVEQVVVAGALQGQVVERRWPAVDHPADMMRLTPLGRSVAAGEAAVLVADDQGVVEGGGDGAGGGAVVQDAGAPGDEHAVKAGVAEQAPDAGGGEDRPVGQPALAAGLEVVEGGDDVEVGAGGGPRGGPRGPAF